MSAINPMTRQMFATVAGLLLGLLLGSVFLTAGAALEAQSRIEPDAPFRTLHPETYWRRRADLLQRLQNRNMEEVEQIRTLAQQLREELLAASAEDRVPNWRRAEQIEKIAGRIQSRIKGRF